MKNMDVLELKRRIDPGKEGDQLIFFFRDRQLQDDDTLGSYGIEKESTITLCLSPHGGDKRTGTKIKVSVANSEEEFRNTTVEELKRKLLSEDSRYKHCGLYCNHKLLFHDRTLGSHGIKHNDIIVTEPPMRPQSLSSEDECEGLPPPEDEDVEMPRTESMEKLAPMQQTEPESSGSCWIL
ncbi:ubiquitin-like isoform X1 [Labeo rohita]|uniref:Ubiquitin-like isoform X1 n=1 Tax=Labeo rohita TaxID=84645 RepID=A0A498MHW6_LABRO|nr:ubiquitin-like isoform X1 [Labeo rohita]